MGDRELMWYPDWIYRLNDARDVWRGPDKPAHFFGPAWIAAELNPELALFVVVVWELVQAALWMSLTPTKRLMIEDGKIPWPFMHDRASLKDIAVGVLGIGAHRVLTWAGL